MEPTIPYGEGQQTVLAYNVKAKEVQVHIVSLDVNDDYVFTAEDGTFFKLSGSLKSKALLKKLKEHEEVNKGQVTVEEAQARRDAKLKSIEKLKERQQAEETTPVVPE